MKELSPELYQQIEKEALDSNKNLRDRTDYEGGYIQGLQDGYEKGATKYALLLEDAERLNEERNFLFSPVLDYGQSAAANIPLGASITTVILERAKVAAEMAEALGIARTYIENCKNDRDGLIANRAHGDLFQIDKALATWTAIGEADKKEENNG